MAVTSSSGRRNSNPRDPHLGNEIGFGRETAEQRKRAADRNFWASSGRLRSKVCWRECWRQRGIFAGPSRVRETALRSRPNPAAVAREVAVAPGPAGRRLQRHGRDPYHRSSAVVQSPFLRSRHSPCWPTSVGSHPRPCDPNAMSKDLALRNRRWTLKQLSRS